MAQPYLSIIIPAYNEAERISQSLIAMDKALEGAEYSYEIIVVDNASTDDTRGVVNGMMKLVRNLKLVEGKVPGKGGAVRTGMRAAEGRIRLFTDADNSTSIDQFNAMMPFFKEGYGVVIGSRTAQGATLDPPEGLFRRFAGKTLNLVVRMLLVRGFGDTQCGFKAFTDDAANKIFSVSQIDGWAFDVELLVLAERFGFRVKEMPVHWVNDERSHVRMSAGLQFLKEICVIRWRLWKGRYPLPTLDSRS